MRPLSVHCADAQPLVEVAVVNGVVDGRAVVAVAVHAAVAGFLGHPAADDLGAQHGDEVVEASSLPEVASGL